MISPIDGLLFDLDGTLVDSDPMHKQTWGSVLARFGIALDDETYRRDFSGRLNPDIVARLLPQLDRAACVALGVEKEALFRDLTPRLDPLPGAAPLIERARQRGRKLALVTNAPRLNALHMLRAIGLADVWDAIVVAEEIGVGKPDPAPYRAGLSQLGIAAERAVAFEDSATGVQAAAGAGIFTVGLTTSHAAEGLTGSGARLIARDFEDPALAPLRL